ncbi:hypothetical protein C8J56DRAFT_1050707 [Mycena floridula]|nr:hypothetical protein C8J56DRAFT_1050707 [Mycena floridula]
MTEEEVLEWMDGGSSVQWFRAEAEMLRWHEQTEKKQADFLRTITSFCRMAEIWGDLAEKTLHAGHRAYAKKKAAMYRRMEEECRGKLIAARYKSLLTKGDMSIAEYIQAQRDAEAELANST